MRAFLAARHDARRKEVSSRMNLVVMILKKMGGIDW